MEHLKNALWIWENSNAQPDEHAEFIAEFDYSRKDGKAFLSISADSEYGVYLNGKFVEFGQYPDYPHYKVYDRFDVSEHLVEGKNIIAIEAWYLGNNCSTNIDDGAGLCFSLDAENKNLLLSDANILSRISKVYTNYACKYITGQLGFGYGYDSTLEDDWKNGASIDFTRSVEVTPAKPLPDVLRPVKKLVTENGVVGKLIKQENGEGCRYLFDFGRELVGIYSLKFNSPSVQDVEIAYGEHIVDGWVRDKIHSRRFSFAYKAKKGLNDYFGYLRRLGLRYIELRTKDPIDSMRIEIMPRTYPIDVLPFETNDVELDQIYQICINTLRLCMHEHYEDCPWREQAMYVMDSRNQMLCGYYAFKEYDFPRACIKLMAEDRRSDGMLSITYPGASGLVIPSFGLHFYTAVREYGDYSGDWDFVDEVFPKLLSLIDAFMTRYDENEGLLHIFGDSCYWNFYEWSKGLEGTIGAVTEERVDLIINALFSMALQNMDYICQKLGKESDYDKFAERINISINKKFKNTDNLLYGMYDPNGEYSELGNALAILCGAADDDSARRICELLSDDNSELVKITLSMKCFKYDALLKVDEKKYSSYVISDIRRIYKKMLDFGSTTVWETELGEADFGKAGSLCHGWSALPVYYLHKLL